MDAATKERLIRAIAAENTRDPVGSRVRWSNHAVGELVAEAWQRSEVEFALQQAEVIEDYPAEHRRLPDCLVIGWLMGGGPMHAVIGVDAEHARILVVTVYRPEPERWTNDWRTRRR